MAYTTINKSTDYFNTLLYTGNDADGNAITGVGHSPDFVWIKQRNAMSHRLYDKIRGVNSAVSSDNNAAENQYAGYGQFESFDSDGFTVGVGTNTNGTQGYGTNQNSQSIVSWNWKANGAGSANTDGSINSTVSVNQTAGFSIVKWTGTQSLGTVGHGLNATPDVILIKNVSAGENWIMYHVGLGGNTKNLYLDANNAVDTRTDTFNSTSPTSSLFTVNTATGVNKSGSTMMAYCFAEKTGYSKFGSYVGNGNADGTFIYTGFKPAFFITKNTTTGSSSWMMYDNKRDPDNQMAEYLYPNEAVAAGTSSSGFDFLSNGIKIRNTFGDANVNGNTFIYMAFAEAPLVGSNNIPCTAR